MQGKNPFSVRGRSSSPTLGDNTKGLRGTSDVDSSYGEVVEFTDVSPYGDYNAGNDYLQPTGKPPKDWKNWRQWLRFLEASDSQDLTMAQMFLYNKDLRPVESRRRKWKWWNFVNFWVADSVNINSFQIAATGVQAGLTWWECWLAIWLGYFISGLFVVWTARVGSYAHLGFPVSCRASFGIYGSLWPVINRVVMAIIWFSTQTWILGQCIQVMLEAIFGTDLNDRIGTRNLSGTTSFYFLCFFLAWLVQLPAIWLSPQTVRHLFSVKAVLSPAAAFAFMIWSLVKAHGAGPVIDAKDTLSSHDKGWNFVTMTMSCIANYATLILNSPDFSRFARRPSDATWSQSVTIPVAFSITSLIGLLISSSSKSLYGYVEWQPLEVLSLYMQNGWTAGNRGGAFLIATGLGLAQIGTNISANTLSAGMDMTALFPRLINIRRGGYVCAAIALCICPWHFFEGSNTFTTYLSAYSVFLSSISGVVMADYWWLRRGKLVLHDLYVNDKNTRYMYGTSFGCNWRGFAAYLLSLVPNIPGFAGQVGRAVPSGAIYLYKLNYFVGFLVSFFLYVLFNWLAPPMGIPEEVQGRLFDRKVWLEEVQDVEDFESEIRAQHRGRVSEVGSMASSSTKSEV